MENALKAKIGKAAFAFRGYNVTNLGKSPELLAHPAYGRLVEKVLRQVSEISADTLGQRVDLVARVREREGSTLASFSRDVATIVAMEVAQLRILEEFFGISARQARLSFGYSIGELSALLLGDVFKVQHILPVPLAMAAECAELAQDVTMGILFTRGPSLTLEEVRRLCVTISAEGHGMLAPSAYLAPNTVLLLGQRETIAQFRSMMHDYLPEKVMLRTNPHQWPPLHTSILWERNIPNRCAMSLYKIPGGLVPPSPPVISCVTGTASYNEYNARHHLVRWADHPQLLWDVMYETLRSGVETVIHVGPEPNLIPATFARLSANVSAQLGGKFMRLLGGKVVNGVSRRAWLTRMLPSKSALLRAPFLDHIILEDWLLGQKPL